jgi:hypothetical protein
MTEPAPNPSDERILDTMIGLAHAARSHRVIVAGSSSYDVYLGLLERGFSRVATTATCRIPCGQREVALIAGRHSMQAFEALLVRIVSFLNARATMAIWVDFGVHQHGQRLQLLLERLGFRVEAGAKCGHGFVLSARRHEWNQGVNVA